MDKYLPSKKFTLIVGTSAVVLLLGYFGYTYFASGKTIFTKKDPRVGVAVGDVINRDTDLDGIPDWEEALWGTDPEKKDSDGNGITDDVEINARRDAVNTDSGTENPDGQINETERFAREFFTTISSLKASGDLNQNSITNLALGFGKNISEYQKLPDTYTRVDVKTVPATSQTRQSYYTALKDSTTTHAADIGTELDALARGIDNENPEDMVEVARIGGVYTSIALELAQVSVPEDAAALHLSLLNNYTKIGTALKNTSSLLDNPLIGLIGLSQYNDEDALAAETIENLGEYFKSHDII